GLLPGAENHHAGFRLVAGIFPALGPAPLHLSRLQKRTVASALPETSVLPVGAKASELTRAVWPGRTLTSFPCAGSHTRIVPSLPPAARIRPSGLKARHTSSVPPAESTFSSLPVSMSQSLIRPSQPVVASVRPPGENTTASTSSAGPSISRTIFAE